MLPRRIRLLVGLGNPGKDYRNTRHNAGFLVVDRIAATFAIAIDRRRFDVETGRGLVAGRDLILAKPQSYMNRSGPPVFRLAAYFKILCEEMLVVHDDIDLAFGRIKIKEKGGHGGHNGLRSLIDAFGGGDFARVRIGIGRSDAATVTDHVLGRFKPEEAKALDQIVGMAADAIVTILDKGIREAMNRFNNRIVITSS